MPNQLFLNIFKIIWFTDHFYFTKLIIYNLERQIRIQIFISKLFHVLIKCFLFISTLCKGRKISLLYFCPGILFHSNCSIFKNIRFEPFSRNQLLRWFVIFFSCFAPFPYEFPIIIHLKKFPVTQTKNDYIQ